jgi:hypothetical protein
MEDKPKRAADAPKGPSEQDRIEKEYAERHSDDANKPRPEGTAPAEDTGSHP